MIRRSCIATLLFCLAGCGSQVNSELPVDSPSPQESPSPSATPEPEPDTGDGHDGDITVDLDRVINTCVEVVNAGTETLQLSSTVGLEVGDRILVHQVQDTFAVSGVTTTITNANLAGVADVRTVTDIDQAFVTVDSPLSVQFTSGTDQQAQVCDIPQYTDVTVTVTGRMLAQPWDGASGGVIAFYANGVVTLNGPVDASGSGFRGGIAVGNSEGTNVTTEDTNQNNGGGKGEGLDARSFVGFGRGSFGNAGGGGNAHNTGGGGGGNGGSGGIGGDQPGPIGSNPNTVGRGGGAVAIDGALTFGGGGGAGHQNGNAAGDGGVGGGIVWMTVNELTGNGAVSAGGARGGDSGNATSSDGGGGGGAGGTAVVRVVVGDGYTGLVSAIGGDGGDSLEAEPHGPGGGGGGGRVMLADLPDTTGLASGGLPGQASNATPHAATAGATGTITVLPPIEP